MDMSLSKLWELVMDRVAGVLQFTGSQRVGHEWLNLSKLNSSAADLGSISWKIPWRRERLPTPVFWPGKFHGLSMDCPWCPKELDMTERISLSLTFRSTYKKLKTTHDGECPKSIYEPEVGNYDVVRESRVHNRIDVEL